MIDLACAAFAVALLSAENIYLYAFPKRRMFALRLVGVCAVFLVIALFFPRGNDLGLGLFGISLMSFIRFFGLFALSVGAMMLCYRGKFWHIFAACTSGYATQHFADRVGRLFMLIPALDFSFRGAAFVNLLIYNPLIYLLAWFVFARPVALLRLKQYGDTKMNILSVSTILMCIVVSRIGDYGRDDVLLNVAISIYGLIVSAMALCVQYVLFVQRNKESELAFTEYNLEKEKAQYDKWSESIGFINAKCHDLKHGLALLDRYGDSAEIAETKAAIEVYDSRMDTGNDVLDALLEEKSRAFKEVNVQFACVADGAQLKFISKHDIYSLFGNILDNAARALAQVEDANNRVINLSVKRIGDMLVIHQDNIFSGDIEFSDGLPLSSRRDDPNHGFGIKSISLIVKKYKGTMNISAQNGIYSINIIVPVPSP